jgi:hypothetical protein
MYAECNARTSPICLLLTLAAVSKQKVRRVYKLIQK